jgi:CHASE2 domain-containing sensor protein
MSDVSGIQQTIQKMAEQALKDQAQSGSSDKGTAAASDVERLKAAMEQGPAQAQGVEAPSADPAVEGAQQVEAASKVERTSPGDKILDSVQNMRSGYQTALADLEQALRSGTASPAELLSIQTKVQAVTLQQDMMGKIVGKSEQNVDQLLKGQ